MAKRATKQQQPQPPRGHSWSVYHIKHTPAQFVGIVDNAPDEQTAIERAIEVRDPRAGERKHNRGRK